jgi:hypothetical protein
MRWIKPIEKQSDSTKYEFLFHDCLICWCWQQGKMNISSVVTLFIQTNRMLNTAHGISQSSGNEMSWWSFTLEISWVRISTQITAIPIIILRGAPQYRHFYWTAGNLGRPTDGLGVGTHTAEFTLRLLYPIAGSKIRFRWVVELLGFEPRPPSL